MLTHPHKKRRMVTSMSVGNFLFTDTPLHRVSKSTDSLLSRQRLRRHRTRRGLRRPLRRWVMRHKNEQPSLNQSRVLRKNLILRDDLEKAKISLTRIFPEFGEIGETDVPNFRERLMKLFCISHQFWKKAIALLLTPLSCGLADVPHQPCVKAFNSSQETSLESSEKQIFQASPEVDEKLRAKSDRKRNKKKSNPLSHPIRRNRAGH